MRKILSFFMFCSALFLLASFVSAAHLGEQKTLVILINFNDTQISCNSSQVQGSVFSNNDSADNFFRVSSFNQTWLTGQVIEPINISYNQDNSTSCNYPAWADEADNITISEGYNISDYDHKVYVFPPACGYGGLAYVDGAAPYNRAWIFSCSSNSVYSHELGHTLGMMHASSVEGQSTLEYGDGSDVMGNGYFEQNLPHKVQMNWFNPSDYLTLNFSDYGTYSISPVEFSSIVSSLPHGIRIYNSNASDFYYFSYRVASGLFDSSFSDVFKNRLSVHEYDGVLQTKLLQTAGDGQSFTDPNQQFSIEVLNHSDTNLTIQLKPANVCVRNGFNLTASDGIAAYPNTSANFYVTLTNLDSGDCGSSNYTFSSIAPDGWNYGYSSSTLVVPTLSSASTFAYFSVPSNATPKTKYPVVISASSNEFSVNLSRNISVILPCTYKGENMTISPQFIYANNSDNINFTINITNFNTYGCDPWTYNLFQSSYPAGWTGTLNPSLLTIPSGNSSTSILSISISSSNNSGNYTSTVLTNGPLGMKTVSGTISIAPSCSINNPIVNVLPSTVLTRNNTYSNFSVYVTNNNSLDCPIQTYYPTYYNSYGWNGTFSPTSLSLDSTNTSSTLFKLFAPVNSVSGNYTVSILVNGTDNNLTVNLDSTPPSKPTLTGKIISGGSRYVNLSWTASTDSSGIKRYDVYKSSSLIGSTTGTNYTDRSGRRGTFSYYVVALDNVENSIRSNTVSVKV